MDKPAYDFLILLNDLARVIRTEADRRARDVGGWTLLTFATQCVRYAARR
ncbi:MAG: hypothetical protein HIU84_09655 [Acidobacteria bacterium]|nr:hypothetical protein [Acidobacteriota bacterium]